MGAGLVGVESDGASGYREAWLALDKDNFPAPPAGDGYSVYVNDGAKTSYESFFYDRRDAWLGAANPELWLGGFQSWSQLPNPL